MDMNVPKTEIMIGTSCFPSKTASTDDAVASAFAVAAFAGADDSASGAEEDDTPRMRMIPRLRMSMNPRLRMRMNSRLRLKMSRAKEQIMSWTTVTTALIKVRADDLGLIGNVNTIAVFKIVTVKTFTGAAADREVLAVDREVLAVGL